MNDDLLDRATRALSYQTEASAGEGEDTLAQILDALEETEATRSSRERAGLGWAAAAALILAAVAAGPTAWAWSVDAVESLFSARPSPVSAAPLIPPEAPRDPPRPAPASPPPPAPSVELEPAPSEPPEAMPTRATSAHATRRARATRPTPPVALDPAARAERERFETAHRLHFGGGAPERTLAAWDDYLGAYPAGRYAPEARYNRALTLIRLGRTDAASDALEDLRRRGFRSREAGALLDAMASP